MKDRETEERYKMNWAISMMERGTIVKLSIGGWNGTTKLDPIDFGIKYCDEEAERFSNKYINFGTVKLFPPEIFQEINSLKTKARKVLMDHSYATVWGRFIPHSSFHKWEEDNNELREDFRKASIELGKRYEEIINFVKKDFSVLAKDVWHRIYPNKGPAPNHFITSFNSKMIAKIPSKIELIDSFYYNVTFLKIPIPSQLESEISKTKDTLREESYKNYKHKLELEAQLKIQNYYEKEMKSHVDMFVENTVVKMRSHVAEVCEEILASIKNKKEMSKVKFDKLKSLVEKIYALNFFDDTEMGKMFEKLNAEINKPYVHRKDSVINELVAEIHEESVKELDLKEIHPIIEGIEI